MVLACIGAHDPTGGGTLAALTGWTSLNVPGVAGQDSHLVGYYLDGISVNECTITCAADDRWPTAGFSLKPTANGTATTRCKAVHWFDNPTPVRAGEAISFAGTSGANDMFCILYFDVAPFNYVKPTDSAKAPVYKWSRTTAASGTNLTALTVQSGLVSLTAFGDHQYEIDDIAIAAAFTTNPIIGLKVDKPDWPYTVWFPLPLTDVAQMWDKLQVPPGMLKIVKGDTLNVSWLGETAEQPTATITFKYAAGR